MTKKMLAIFAVAMIIFLSFSVLAALTASISMPRMVLYQNITTGEILEFENSVGVINDNDHEVKINVEPIGVWKDRVVIEENEFTMQPGEEKDVYYNIKIEKAGYYEGKIVVTFSDNLSKDTLSMAQKLVVIVKDENGNVPGEVKDPYNDAPENDFGKYGLFIAGFVFIFVLAVVLIKLKGNKK